MLQMDFPFFNDEIIHGFTYTFAGICSAPSHPFGFQYRIKRTPFDIIKFIVTTLMNQDKKVVFIRVQENGSLASFPEFMKTCHNMNIIVKNKGWDVYSLNGKIEIPNKALVKITRPLLLKSRNNFGVLPFSMLWGLPAKLRIYFVVMFLTYSAWNNTFIQTHQNMGCESLHHQWTCYKK